MMRVFLLREEGNCVHCVTMMGFKLASPRSVYS